MKAKMNERRPVRRLLVLSNREMIVMWIRQASSAEGNKWTETQHIME